MNTTKLINLLDKALKNDYAIKIEELNVNEFNDIKIRLLSYHLSDVYSTNYVCIKKDEDDYPTFLPNFYGSYHHTKKQDNLSMKILEELYCVVNSAYNKAKIIEELDTIFQKYDKLCEIIYYIKYSITPRTIETKVIDKDYHENNEILIETDNNFLY